MRRQALAALVMVPLLALGASSCGGGDGQGNGTATGKPAAKEADKMREFARCMRANGVDMPDPDAEGRVSIRHSGPPTRIDEKMKTAQQKCRHLMPNGGKPPKPKPEQLAKMRAESKCMRENGVPDFPDPDPASGGIAIKARKGGGLDPDSQTFKNAQKKCAPAGARMVTHGGDGPGLSGSGDGK
ncbi:hypothetical protein [Actinomadura rugatobispora]|uniref:Secreted protein n=1 Tax=Actinomadura rugatobispora TaxID=1994 RepID=A0ABW0ZZG9_9ACTN|nr:hypothetical protein GCM10010200_011960 [Actinomadura rugatobispora]